MYQFKKSEFFSDCGSTFNLTHGRVDFSGRTTTYNQIVPLTCDEGYQIKGSHYLTCLEDGAWSTDSSCVKMGEYTYVHFLRSFTSVI